jgi:multicomponent Na+:H+ antiporter subunit E
MSKHSIFAVIFATALLTLVWVILRESLTPRTILTGMAVSVCCLYFCHRFLPIPKTSGIRFFRLIIYLLYLIGQVYISGAAVIKLIFTGAAVEVVQVRTKITNTLLKTLLVNSITLIPGSVSLELQDDIITVLWLVKKSAEKRMNPDEALLHKLERMLKKAEV